jgi:hypothetical protein
MQGNVEVYLEDMKRYLSEKDYQRFLIYHKLCQKVPEGSSPKDRLSTWFREVKKAHDEMLERVRAKKNYEIEMAEAQAKAERERELKEALARLEEIKAQDEERARAKAYKVAKEEFSQYQMKIRSLTCQLKRKLSHLKKWDIYTFLAKYVPEFSKLKDFEPWSWCQLREEDKESCRSTISKVIGAEFKRGVPEELRSYLTWEAEWWQFLLPQRAKYCFVKLPCLQWVFNLHVVARVEVWQKAGEYSMKFQDFPFALSLKNKPLGKFLMYIPPHEFDLDLTLSIPLKLLSGLFFGEIEPQGTRILEQSDLLITYEVNELKAPIALHQEFIDFIRKMREREQPLWEAFQNYELIDGVTARIIANKVTPVTSEVAKIKVPSLPEPTTEVFGALVGMGISKEDARAACSTIPESNFNLPLEDRIKLALRYLQPKEGAVEGPTPQGRGGIREEVAERISSKDKGYLRKICKASSFFSYAEWGKALGLSKTGSLRTLHRLEQMDLIHLEKYPTGEGFKATLTPKGEEKLAAK